MQAADLIFEAGAVALLDDRWSYENEQIAFRPCVRKPAATPAQKEMQNSSMQLRNLMQAFQVIEPQPAGTSGPSQAGGGLARMLGRVSQQLVSAFGSGPRGRLARATFTLFGASISR